MYSMSPGTRSTLVPCSTFARIIPAVACQSPRLSFVEWMRRLSVPLERPFPLLQSQRWRDRSVFAFPLGLRVACAGNRSASTARFSSSLISCSGMPRNFSAAICNKRSRSSMRYRRKPEASALRFEQADAIVVVQRSNGYSCQFREFANPVATHRSPTIVRPDAASRSSG